MPQSLGGPRGISFSLSRAVVENGPDMLKLIPQGSQDAPETEALHAKVEALALAAGARRRILVANLMEEPPRVRMKA